MVQAVRINRQTLATVQTFNVDPTEYLPRRKIPRLTPRPITPAEYADAAIFTKTDGSLVTVNETFDPITESRTETNRSLAGGVLTITFAVADLPTGQMRANKRQAVKDEGLTRVQAELPGITDFDVLELIREFWLSIAPAARNPTATFQKVIDIYQAARDAITVINGLTGAALKAYDPVTGPAWPA